MLMVQAKGATVPVGVVVAFVVAAISVKWMVNYLSRHRLEIFGYYRVIVAAVATVFLLSTKMIWM